MRRRSPSGPAKANEDNPKKGWRGSPSNRVTPEQGAKSLAKEREKGRAWSPEQIQEHLQILEQLLLEGRTDRDIRSYMLSRYSVRSKRVAVLTHRIHQEWELEDERNRRAYKGKAMRRIERYLRQAEGRRAPSQRDPNGNVIPGPWIEKPNHQALARYTSLLMDIQGTRAPLEIKVDVRIAETLTSIVANLNADEVQQIIEQHAEDRRLADRARQLLPPSEFITVNGTSTAAE